MRELVKLCAKHKDANPEVFVDDTSMHAVGKSFDQIRKILIPCLLAFKALARRLKLKLSPKAAFVSSNF